MLQNVRKKDAQDIQSLAKKGARKICAYGTCTVARQCSHTNHKCNDKADVSNDVCPLAKFRIEPEPDNTLWLSCIQPDTELSRNERLSMCAVCENSEGGVNNHGEIIFDCLNAAKCLGCPVLN